MINKLKIKVSVFAKNFINMVSKINYIFLNNSGKGKSYHNKFFISIFFINLLEFEGDYLSIYLEMAYLNKESSRILQELNIFIDSLTLEYFINSYYRQKFDLYKLNFENLNRVAHYIYKEKDFLEMNEISNKLRKEQTFYWSNVRPAIEERFGDVWERNKLNNVMNGGKIIKTDLKLNTTEIDYSSKELFLITTISIALIIVIIK